MYKVVVITVTYNSSNYLERLINALNNQTVKVYKAIIVDNNSKAEHKEKIFYLAHKFDYIEVVNSPENLGGAGGFEMGTRYVLEHYPDYNWLWIMDDDAFPKEDCLEKLLLHSELDSIGALVPVIFGTELQKFQLFHHKKESKFLNKDLFVAESIENLDEVNEIESNAFVGPLIKRDAIETVGIPDGSLFIYGDDLEYIYRISRKFKVYLIKSAIIYHRDIVADSSTFNAQVLWKTYYMYRNRLLFINKYATSRFQKMIGRMLIYFEMQKRILGTLARKKYKGNKHLRIKCIKQAWKDGNKGKKGKIIDPSEFSKLVK